jgi:mono/diheme cytochrome c family protein
LVRPLWLSLVAASILFASDAEGQKAGPTTRSGVYSGEQAGRGEDVYAGNCKSCHTPESHTGAQFKATWNGRRLSELYAFLRERMPKNEPGSLTRKEYADVLAYMLKLNRMPEGADDLPADSTALRAIRIETTVPIRKDQ